MMQGRRCAGFRLTPSALLYLSSFAAFLSIAVLRDVLELGFGKGKSCLGSWRFLSLGFGLGVSSGPHQVEIWRFWYRWSRMIA
jgi:hypothetical protein